MRDHATGPARIAAHELAQKVAALANTDSEPAITRGSTEPAPRISITVNGFTLDFCAGA
jgi:hypothetical protein